MKNIHILPKNKLSRLVKNNLGLIRVNDDFTQKDLDFIQAEFVNIYITNDEKPEEGDWLLIIDDFETYVHEHKGDNLPTTYHKKIILTTDQNLIKDGVKAINDEFLEWFVKNPSCQEVEVRKIEDEIISPKNPKIRFNALQDPPSFISAESLNNMILTYKYKIIIPKEEPTNHPNPLLNSLNKKANKQEFEFLNGFIPTSFFDKQETLEEACNRVFRFPKDISKVMAKRRAIELAKWQQEQILDFLYSEITERRDYSASKMCEKVIEFIGNLKNK